MVKPTALERAVMRAVTEWRCEQHMKALPQPPEIDFEKMSRSCGMPMSEVEAALERCLKRGWIEYLPEIGREGRYRYTSRGLSAIYIPHALPMAPRSSKRL